MLRKLTMSLLVFFLRFAMVFVPREEYEAKIAAIPPMEEKNADCDLRGWEYRSIPMAAGEGRHRYYVKESSDPEAPVFLFLHGLMLDGRTFVHMARLSDRWTLIAYDFPEQCSRYRGELDDFVALVREFARLRGIERMYLMGVSFGATVAVRFAASVDTPRVEALVVASAGIAGSTELALRQARGNAEWMTTQPDYRIYWLMERILNWSVRELDDQSSGEMQSVARVKHPDYYRQVILSLADYDGSDDARRITIPVQALLGQNDILFYSKHLRDLRDFIPHAHLTRIRGGSHAMVFLRGEEIARCIRAFFDTNATPSDVADAGAPGRRRPPGSIFR